MDTSTRRGLLAQSALALSLPVIAGAADAPAPPQKPLKVVVVGAHPDDPESSVGGTIARLADLGHDVVVLYLTRGEAGIAGKTAKEAAEIRTAEAEAACKILKARPVFAGQVDGATEISAERYVAFAAVLNAERPDVVFAHWPVDKHRDHRAASMLAFDAWVKARQAFALYYFEVMTGRQSHLFHPTHYVDISATEGRKRAACMCHASQHPEKFYEVHGQMNQFRGREHGCEFAEAFVHHNQSRAVALP